MNVTKKLKFGMGRVENIVRKGENAGYQHFLLFPQCFQKSSSQGSFKFGIVWYRVNYILHPRTKCRITTFCLFPIMFSKGVFLGSFNLFPNKPWFLHVCSTNILKTLLGKGAISCKEQVLLFPQCFLPFQKTFCHFIKFTIVICELFKFEELKICRLAKG